MPFEKENTTERNEIINIAIVIKLIFTSLKISLKEIIVNNIIDVSPV